MGPTPDPVCADVIVIGAGLSGLQAAVDIQSFGFTCLVLEARSRVGGKTWSAQSEQSSVKVELGAAWTNSENQPRVLALARELGIEMITQNIMGSIRIEGHGQFAYGQLPCVSISRYSGQVTKLMNDEIPDDDQAAYAKVINEFESLCHTVPLADLSKSLASFGTQSTDSLALSLGATSLVRQFVNLWTCAMLGLASTDVPAVYFLHYCHSGGGLMRMRSDDVGGGQHLRFRSGTQSLSVGLAGKLRKGSLVMGAAVERIEQTISSGCTVTTRDGRTFLCKKVISSVPSTLLKDVATSPAFSADKQWLISQSSLGFYAKVYLIYDSPWWRELGLCGLSQGFSGPVSLTRDTSSEDDEFYALTCFVVGESGKTWAANPSREARIDNILSHVDRIYGRSCPKPKSVIEQNWKDEEFSQGAPCPVVAGCALQSLGRDQWRPEGHLHFAGTEMSTVWKGYMEGALTSGAAVADEVLDALRPGRTKLRQRL